VATFYNYGYKTSFYDATSGEKVWDEGTECCLFRTSMLSQDVKHETYSKYICFAPPPARIYAGTVFVVFLSDTSLNFFSISSLNFFSITCSHITFSFQSTPCRPGFTSWCVVIKQHINHPEFAIVMLAFVHEIRNCLTHSS
jgi:hypothetical protein